MSTAIMSIDQVGLPAGTPGVSRTDGLSSGVTVTLKSLGTGSTHKFELLWVPPGDTTAVNSLAQNPLDPTEWTFNPTLNQYGTYRIRLIVDEEYATRVEQIRLFAVRTPNHALRIPALNEDADPDASLELDGSAQIEASEDNATDYPTLVLNQFRYAGWYRALAEIIDVVESSGGGGITSLANVGGGAGIFRNLAAGTANLRTLVAAGNITVTQNADTLTISDVNSLTSVAPANVTRAAAAVGTGTKAAREDHKHDVSVAAPVAITDSTNTQGVASSLALSDHAHAHGNRGGGTLHALVTTSDAGFMSAADKVKLDAITPGSMLSNLANVGGGADVFRDITGSTANLRTLIGMGGVTTTVMGDTIEVNGVGLLSTVDSPVDVTKSAAAVGSATTAARADHKHNISTAVVTDITDGTNAEGTATSLARSDHTHSHGTRGGGTLHAAVTTSVNGFMSAADKTKLDGIAAGATNSPLATIAPVNVTKAAAAVGTGTTAARDDHKHDITTAAAIDITDGSNAEGTATSLARSDHTHSHGNRGGGALHAAVTTSVNGFMIAADKTKLDGIATGATNTPLASVAPVNVTKATAVVGVGTTAARDDHKHDINTAVAIDITDSTNAEGTATSLARSDHAHSHGTRGGGSLHALVTTSVAGFMSAADKTKLDGVATGATNSPLSNTAPVNVTKAAASAGVSASASRDDHKHDITTAVVTDITDSTNAEGTATSLARSDHTHSHGTRGGGTLHAAVTTSVNGFMIAADKSKLDGIAAGAEVNAAANVGAGANVWRDKTSGTLNFRTLSGVNGHNAVVNADVVQIGAINGTTSWTNNQLTNLKTASFNGEYDNGNGGSAKNIDWNNGAKQKVTLNSASCAFTFTMPPGPCSGLILKTIQDATGGRLATYPASPTVKFPNNRTLPTLSTTANAVDIFSFYYDGTTLFVSFAPNFA